MMKRLFACLLVALALGLSASPSGAESAATHKSDQLYRQGVELGKAGKFKEAEQKFRQAVETDPRNADAYNGWGIALSNQRRQLEAI
ncbi:MAG: tetratricopeptide repeat protein, partial [Nitrospirota bacterium]